MSRGASQQVEPSETHKGLLGLQATLGEQVSHWRTKGFAIPLVRLKIWTSSITPQSITTIGWLEWEISEV